jgi:hypothetical protein
MLHIMNDMLYTMVYSMVYTIWYVPYGIYHMVCTIWYIPISVWYIPSKGHGSIYHEALNLPDDDSDSDQP